MLRFKRSCALLCAVLLCGTFIIFAADSGSAYTADKESLEALPDAQKESLTAAAADGVVSLVRASAYYGSMVIGKLENGTEVTVLGHSGEFYCIDLYDVTGYIARHQVKEENGKYYVNCNTDSGETDYLALYTAGEALSMRVQLRAYALCFLGVPYADGGTTPRGFDCCGFTYFVFQKQGYDLHRALIPQLKNGVAIPKEELQCGDLVFFRGTTDLGLYTSHVGMYIGNNQIIHASNSGIAVADLNNPYYIEHYLCSRRVILTDTAHQSLIPGSGIGQSVNSSYWRESTQTGNGLGDIFFFHGRKGCILRCFTI